MRLERVKSRRNALVFVNIFLLAVSAIGCGSDDDAKKDSNEANGPSQELAFTDAAAGQQYLVVPYAIGDVATVDGAGAEKVSFGYKSGAATAAAELKLQNYAHTSYSLFTAANKDLMDRHEYEIGKRMLIRLFDRERGMDQNPALWNIARELDGVDALTAQGSAKMNLVANSSNSKFMKTVQRWSEPKSGKSLQGKKSLGLEYSMTNQTTCTVTDDEVVRPDGDLEKDVADVDEDNIFDEDDYCLVVVSDPVSVTVDEIKAAASEIITRYKDVIYKDQMTGATDFTFKPVIVVIDFKDSEYWEAENPVLNSINGVFIPEMSDITKHPMVYMAADLAKVLGDTTSSADTLKRFWLGTLAHEMQHAISDFFKKRKGSGSLETVAIEEGQAHFMEALFGYGDEVFEIHAKPFLDVFAFGAEPILRSNDIFQLSGRGAAYTLLYYLASQKGGVEFTDGVVSGGEGLTYILDLVRDSEDEGASHLSSEFGGKWIETVGNYIGALAVDGTDVEDITDEHTVDAPKTGIKDLSGGTDNKFGFRFNGGGVEDHLGEYEAITGDTFSDDVEQTFYGFMPALYTVEDSESVVTITSSIEENWGVTKVRVK